jgi:hypothetical protein
MASLMVACGRRFAPASGSEALRRSVAGSAGMCFTCGPLMVAAGARSGVTWPRI